MGYMAQGYRYVDASYAGVGLHLHSSARGGAAHAL